MLPPTRWHLHQNVKHGGCSRGTARRGQWGVFVYLRLWPWPADGHVKVKKLVWNYLSTLVQKRTAYRGTHVGAFNLEFWSQINEVFSSEETLWLLNLGRKPLTTMTRAGFEPTLLPSRRFTVINRKPYTLTTRPRRKQPLRYKNRADETRWITRSY